MKIRPFTEADFPMVRRWWGMDIPLEVYPLDSTFILEAEGAARLVLSIYYTNCKLAAFLEGFCGDPEFRGEKRRELSHYLVKHCEDEARARGFKRLIGQSMNEKLTHRWQELGYQMVIENMSSLAKEL